MTVPGLGASETDDSDRRRSIGRHVRFRRGGSRSVLILLGYAALIGVAGGIVALAIGYAMTPIPDPNALMQAKASIIYYSDGKTEIGRFAVQNRVPVKFTQIPKHVSDAVVAAENQTFWTDPGVDLIGLAQAAFGNATGTSQGGASTITQQYVKNYYLTSERSLERKVKEFFIALKVGQRLSKDQILEGYLNTSYFGRGSWGVQTAAQAYFGKDVRDLTRTEGAVLASLLKAPTTYDPAENGGDTSRLEGRFRYTLRGMEAMGTVPEGFAETAELPTLRPPDESQTYEGPNGYLVAAVEEELHDLGYDDAEISRQGLRITTTIDVEAQRSMEGAFDRFFPKQADGLYAGAAAVRPGTGAILAMYGGEDYLERPWNDATQSELEPGSAFETFTLAAKLEKLTPLGDLERRLLDVREPYAESVARPFVDPAKVEVGNQAVLDVAKRAGIPADARGLEPKFLLGSALVAPMDLANAYGTFAAGGRRAEHFVLAEVTDATGQVLTEHDIEVDRTLEATVANQVSFAFQHYSKPVTSGVDRPYVGDRESFGDVTAWYAGYTPQLSAAVAFYRDVDGDGVKEPLKGAADLPTKIWTTFVSGALRGEPKLEFPLPDVATIATTLALAVDSSQR